MAYSYLAVGAGARVDVHCGQVVRCAGPVSVNSDAGEINQFLPRALHGVEGGLVTRTITTTTSYKTRGNVEVMVSLYDSHKKFFFLWPIK